jgi:hypothetical protein
MSKIDVLKQQLTIASAKMTASDKKRATVIDTLLTLQKEKVAAQQKNDTKVQELAIQAAAGGAPLDIVKRMQSSGDPVSAASIGNQYLKGGLESTGSGAGDKVFTTGQKNNGAQNAGLTIEEFDGLSADVKNFFVNGTAASIKWFNTTVQDVQSGSTTMQEAVDTINTSNLPQPVKDYLTQRIKAAAPQGNGDGGGFWSSVGSGISSAADWAWSGLKGIFGL